MNGCARFACRRSRRAAAAAALPWFLCFVLAGSTAVLGYLYWQSVQQPAAAPQSATAAAPTAATSQTHVTTVSTASSGGLALEAKGYIIPTHQILVSPKVNGMVIKLRITESDRVKKGDVLAELEDTEYRADRDRAAAALDSARKNLAELEHGYRPKEIDEAAAELAEAEAQRIQLDTDYRRSADLLEKKVIAQETYDVALSKLQAMTRRVQRLGLALKLMQEGPRIERIEAARAQVHQADAELAKAKWRLENCIVRAPISGTILKKNAEEGSLVNPIAMQGFYSLCEMADLSDLEVESDDPGTRHQQGLSGSEVPGAGRGLSRPCLPGPGLAADAHRRPRQRRHPRPRQSHRAARRGRRLSQTGNGGAGFVPQEDVNYGQNQADNTALVPGSEQVRRSGIHLPRAYALRGHRRKSHRNVP